MLLKRKFPYLFAAALAIAIFSFTAAAQSGMTRQRQVTQTIVSHNLSALDNDPVIVSLASVEEAEAPKLVTISGGDSLRFRALITAAIDERLGARYSWGATGPWSFDCSGFVWSTFQSAGIDFERGSARTLWARFTAPAPEDQFKFGTLVFFSNLAHVGIVADEHGFYHASRHHGVVYSPFNDYWLSRVDGFRKVPMPAPLTTD
ncbi:MAG TPA: C40 family peptidase [Pyrinomonadaceae bacterium]